MTFTIYRADTKGFKQQTAFPEELEVTDFESLKAATEFDHTVILYSPSHRAAKNFQKADAIWMDIDNAFSDKPEEWITLERIQQEFEGISVAVGPSRNHEKQKYDEKTGAPTKGPRPRWHLYFPVPVITDKAKFEGLLQKLLKKYEHLHPDAAIKDAGRQFFGGGDDNFAFYLQEGTPISSELRGPAPGAKSGGRRGKTTILVSEMTAREVEAHPEWIQMGDRHGAILKVANRYARQRKSVDEIFQSAWAFNVRLEEPKANDEVRKIALWSYENVGGEQAFELIKNFYWEKGEDGKLKIIPIRETTPEMFDAMEHFIALEDIGGKRQLSLRKDPTQSITSPSSLSAMLEKCGYLWDVRPAGGLTKDEIYQRFLKGVKSYTRITCVPEHEMEDDTFFVPVVDFPDAQSTGAFREFMDLFTFESVEDRYRFAAGILSLFLSGKWDAQIPLFAIRAPSQNAGKSTVVRRCVEMVSGIAAIEQTGEDVQNDTAQFSGLSAQASRAILYDNLEKLKDNEERAIARAVTDKHRAAWFFGQSRSRIRNSYVYFATFNDSESFGKDMQARALVIKMKDPDTISAEHRIELEGRLEDWEKNGRDRVIADIRHLISLPPVQLEIDENMKVKMPAELTAFQKFSRWSLRILPALRAAFPEMLHFDFSPKEGYRIDEGTEAIGEFLYSAVMEHGEWNKNEEFFFRRSGTDLRRMYNMAHKEAGDIIRSPKLFGTLLRDASKEMEYGTLNKQKSNGILMWTYRVTADEYNKLIEGIPEYQNGEAKRPMPASVKAKLKKIRGLGLVEVD